MKLNELKTQLARYPGLNLRFILPDGDHVPAHVHVTEVGRVDKRFIDCGGTKRTESFCRLQTWSAEDTDHRLTTDKLIGILNKAAPLLESDDLDVDVEHEVGVVTQFPVASVEAVGGEFAFRLTGRHTDCLAKDTCGTSKELEPSGACCSGSCA